MPPIIRPSLFNNNPPQQCRWHLFASASVLEHEAALAIFNASRQALSQRGEFHIVLAGGATPRRVYELLRTMDTDWQKWHVYFGDERCLPVGDAERNSQMAALALLNHVNIPATHIHIIPAEHGAEAAANTYAQILGKVELFDLVLLGLGEDGHTASLFPNHAWGATSAAPAVLAVHDAPKPPSQRVSLSAHRLSQTRQLIFMVSGATKRKAIADWRNGKIIPAAAIAPACGVDVYLENMDWNN